MLPSFLAHRREGLFSPGSGEVDCGLWDVQAQEHTVPESARRGAGRER